MHAYGGECQAFQVEDKRKRELEQEKKRRDEELKAKEELERKRKEEEAMRKKRDDRERAYKQNFDDDEDWLVDDLTPKVHGYQHS